MEIASPHQIPEAGEPTHLRRVHTITDRISMANTYLIIDEQLIVVDPGSELNVQQLSLYLHTILQRSLSDIDLIVLTHLHKDHIAGVEALRKLCAAPVAASGVIREMAQQKYRERPPKKQLKQLTKKMLPGILQHVDLSLPIYQRHTDLVQLWLNDSEALPGHPDWRVIASPGHTPDSICLYNPLSYELLCGDTVITVRGGAPLVRSCANQQQLEETLHVLRSLHIHYLYPGHGRPILGLHPLNHIEVEW